MSAVLRATSSDPTSLSQRESMELATLLGFAKPPVSPMQLATRVERGLSTNVIDRLVKAGVPAARLAFVIAPRTLSHRRARAEDLTPDESGRALRVARVLALATAVFGERARALPWLDRKLSQFDDQTAFDLLKTEPGARLVEEALISIDEGYFA